jgi:hypothetical protein
MPRHSRQNIAELERELLTAAPSPKPPQCKHERRDLYQCGCYDGCETCKYRSRCGDCKQLLGDHPSAKAVR